MEWVKLGSGYFLDVAVACLDDAGEVMFTRGLAYCGQAESGGFVPTVILPTLGRRNQPRTAEEVAESGLWERVDGGYQVRQWHKWESELEALVERRRREAARKRRGRVRGQSADTGADIGGTESREEKDTTTKTVVVRAAPTSRGTRRTRIDEAWRPSDGAWRWAVEQFPGRNLERELAQFRDHHAGKGSVMASWDAAWRTWMRNTDQYPAPGRRAGFDPNAAMARAHAAEAATA